MAKLVTVRILKHIGHYAAGQIVEVDQNTADQLCTPRTRNNGDGVEKTQYAITQEDFELALKTPVELGGLTQGELTEMGLKNIVQTPPDPEADAALAKRVKMAAKAAAAAEAKDAAEAAKLDEQRVNQEQAEDSGEDGQDASAEDEHTITEEVILPPEEEEKPKGKNKKSA